MRIQFLWWADCPSHPEAWRRLNQVLDELGIRAEVERIEVRSDAEAEQWHFRGSPTLLVNGQDIDPRAGERPARLTCRLYFTDDGRPSPLPPVTMIRRALLAARDQTESIKSNEEES